MMPTVRTMASALLAAPALALMATAAWVPVASTPTATADVAVVSAPAPPTQEYCDGHYGRPLGEVFAWRSFTFQKYVGDAACETHRQGAYLGSNVVVDATGDLVISDASALHVRSGGARTPRPTRRRARSGGRSTRSAGCGSPTSGCRRRTSSGASRRDCPSGPPPERAAPCGSPTSRRSTATRCGASSTCSSGTPRGPTIPEAATHATCTDATYASWHHKPATWDWGAGGRTGFHTWAVRKETISGPGGRTVTLSYLYDGRVHAVDTCQEQLPSSTCNAVFDTSWTAILQTAVFADDSAPFLRPADGDAFPTQELVIRDMWVDAL